MSAANQISLEAGDIALEAFARRGARTTEVILTAAIPAGVHIESHAPPDPFLIPTRVEVEGLEDAVVDYPEPARKDIGEAVGTPGVRSPVYEGTVRVSLHGEARPGLDTVRGAVRYQPCVRGTCLPPRTARWEAPLEGEGRTS